mmetsp:Transcript_25974/g.75744  ORF Transcript_25974/g.75744 Transcript_25974/m.75744 type:complete len:404 (-) Transcript_25974:60-1271(-)
MVEKIPSQDSQVQLIFDEDLRPRRVRGQQRATAGPSGHAPKLAARRGELPEDPPGNLAEMQEHIVMLAEYASVQEQRADALSAEVDKLNELLGKAESKGRHGTPRGRGEEVELRAEVCDLQKYTEELEELVEALEHQQGTRSDEGKHEHSEAVRDLERQAQQWEDEAARERHARTKLQRELEAERRRNKEFEEDMEDLVQDRKDLRLRMRELEAAVDAAREPKPLGQAMSSRVKVDALEEQLRLSRQELEELEREASKWRRKAESEADRGRLLDEELVRVSSAFEEATRKLERLEPSPLPRTNHGAKLSTVISADRERRRVLPVLRHVTRSHMRSVAPAPPTPPASGLDRNRRSETEENEEETASHQNDEHSSLDSARSTFSLSAGGGGNGGGASVAVGAALL